jgi:hypothetical protein
MPEVQAPTLPGIDPAGVKRVDEGSFPHLIVEAGVYRLSVLSEVNFEHPDYPRHFPWPFLAGVVEVGLSGEGGLLAEPLRRVELSEVSVIRDRVLQGDLSDFDVEGWGLG